MQGAHRAQVEPLVPVGLLAHKVRQEQVAHPGLPAQAERQVQVVLQVQVEPPVLQVFQVKVFQGRAVLREHRDLAVIPESAVTLE